MQFDLTVYPVESLALAEADLISFVKDTLLKTDINLVDPAEKRVELVDQITEEFFIQFGKFPSPKVLYYLSNYILIEEIKSTHSGKRQREDAFLSPRQIVSRSKREHSITTDVLDVVHSKHLHQIATPKFTGNIEDV